MSDLRARHGDLVHFRIGPQHVFVVMRADLAREVLVTHQRSFKKGPDSNGPASCSETGS